MKTKIITIFFSAILAGSFLFMGFSRFITPDYILKIDNDKVTTAEFNQLFSEYKTNSNLKQLNPQAEIVAKINYIGQLINEISLKKYLNEKIKLNENSVMTVLKKTLGENQEISQFSTSQFQTIIENLGDEIGKEIFLNSLETELFQKIDINEKLLKEKVVKVYKIKGEEFKINSNDQLKYENEIDVFKINIKKVNLVKYIKETVINEDVINSYYQENIEIFTNPEKFSYDQIIIKQENLSSTKFEDYNNDKNLLNSFNKIEEKKILPQVYNVLNSLNEKQESDIFKVGDLNYIVKLNNIISQKIYEKKEVEEEIITNIIEEELKNIDKLNLNEMNNGFIEEEVLYTDSFSFKENLSKKDYRIVEDKENGNFINNDQYYEYQIIKSSTSDIPQDKKNNFIKKYTNFLKQKNEKKNQYNDDNLIEVEIKNINYFLRSLELENNILSEDQLKNVILIKKEKPLKVIVNNKVYVLKYYKESLLNSDQIKITITNIFYNELLNAIKSLYDIEVNNEQLLQ